jgi:hypothetical protein
MDTADTPQAAMLVEIHKELHQRRFEGRLVIMYVQGGIRGVKQQTEKTLDLKTRT